MAAILIVLVIFCIDKLVFRSSGKTFIGYLPTFIEFQAVSG